MDLVKHHVRETIDTCLYNLSLCSPTPYLSFAVAGLASLVALQINPSTRWPWLPLIVTPLYTSLVTAKHATWDFAWSYVWALFIVIYFTHTMHLLYLERHLVPPGPDNTWNFYGAYKVWMDGRGICLNPKRMAGVREGARMSRTRFFVTRILNMAIIYTVLELTPIYLFPEPFMPITLDDYADSKVPFFRRLLFPTMDPITPRDLALRATFAVAWAWQPALQLVFMHNLISLFYVCILRLDAPHEWPPFYGKVTEIRSLRTFWARFWHRVVVRPYAGVAGLVSRHVFGFAARSLPDRFLVHLLIFTLSGGVHATASWAFGQECAIWRDYAWYAAQQPAILLEDQVLAGVEMGVGVLLEKAGVKRASSNGRRVIEIVKTIAGLMYLAAWFFWSVPKWYFPKATCTANIEY